MFRPSLRQRRNERDVLAAASIVMWETIAQMRADGEIDMEHSQLWVTPPLYPIKER